MENIFQTILIFVQTELLIDPSWTKPQVGHPVYARVLPLILWGCTEVNTHDAVGGGNMKSDAMPGTLFALHVCMSNE